jgi:hypothetical protein
VRSIVRVPGEENLDLPDYSDNHSILNEEIRRLSVAA